MAMEKGNTNGRDVMLRKYGPEYYSRIGRKGGSAPRKTPRPFELMTHEQLSEIGRKGGVRSRRRRTGQ